MKFVVLIVIHPRVTPSVRQSHLRLCFSDFTLGFGKKDMENTGTECCIKLRKVNNRYRDGGHWSCGMQTQEGAHHMCAVRNFPEMPSKCGENVSPLASYSLLDK